MYDKAKILAGLALFLALMTSPFWRNLGAGSSQALAAPELSPEAKTAGKCVEALPFMKANHMTLLNQWRDSVTREGNRVYTSVDGSSYAMSLSNTCLRCHSNKAQFCDRCHNMQSVKPKCWSCHLDPGDLKP